MSIDDINYLYEHSVKDSFMFFFDSATRDRSVYPDPNNYVIAFDEPIRFVYGLDIMDASIPNTMFNIDTVNCMVSVTTLASSADESADMQAFNDRLPALLQEQQSNAMFAGYFNGAATNCSAYVISRDDWAAHPELAAYIDAPVDPDFTPVAATLDTFVILVSRWANVPLVPLSSIAPGGQAGFLADPTLTTFVSGSGDTYLLSVSHDAAALLADPSVHVDSISVRYLTDGSGFSMTVSTNVATPVDIGGAAAALSQVAPGTAPVAWNALQMRTVNMEVGQYDINTLQAELQTDLLGMGFMVVSTDRTMSNDLSKQARIMFTNTAAPFVLNMDASTANLELGFDAYAKPSDGTSATEYAQVFFNANCRLFGSTWNATSSWFQVRTPGCVNLIGARYVTLRCQEIESHLSSKVTFSQFSSGIGVFKLQDPRDMTNLRFDYTTFLRKPFHPIGKLTRLTFSFQTGNGTEYDFKGFNHHIMVSVKYLSPDMTRTFHRSSLNPNYDPNYINYVNNLAEFAVDDENAEEDEEEEEDDTDTDTDSDSPN